MCSVLCNPVLDCDNKLVVDMCISDVLDMSLGVDNGIVTFSVGLSVVVRERVTGLVAAFIASTAKLLLSIGV